MTVNLNEGIPDVELRTRVARASSNCNYKYRRLRWRGSVLFFQRLPANVYKYTSATRGILGSIGIGKGNLHEGRGAEVSGEFKDFSSLARVFGDGNRTRVARAAERENPFTNEKSENPRTTPQLFPKTFFFLTVRHIIIVNLSIY